MNRTIFFLLVSFLISGCSVFNPYESDYMCPDVPKGKCATMQQAYSESFNNELVLDKPPCVDCGDKDKSEQVSGISEEENRYKIQQFQKMGKTISTYSSTSPVIQAPKTMRMLVVDYQDDDEGVMYGARYVFFLSGKPKWMVGTK